MRAKVPGEKTEVTHYVHCTACKWRGDRINREGDFGACPKCGARVERTQSREAAKLDKLWRETQGANA